MINQILPSKGMSCKTKVRMYKTILRPPLLHDCEAYERDKPTEVMR